MSNLNVFKLDDIVTAFLNKKRKKKKLELKEIGGKQRVQKKTSKKNKILQTIFNKKVTDNNQIDQILVENNIELTDDSRRYFYNLNKLKSDYNRTLSLPNNLINNKINMYLHFSYNMRYLTSDLLINGYNLAAVLMGEKIIDEIAISKLSKVTFSSNDPIIYLENENVIQEFFLEDFNKNFSYFTFDQDISDYNAVTNKSDANIDFKFNGKKYESKGSADFILIYEEGMNQDKINGLMKDMKFFHRDKSTLKSGLKKIKKSQGLYYFQQTITPTDFSPSYLILYNKYNISVLNKITCDPEDLFNLIYNNIGKNGNLGLFKNAITPFNLEDIMMILLVVSNLINTNYGEALASYDKCREHVFYIKQDYALFRQLCLTFFDNFSSRLNIDRLATCYTLATNYITKAEPYKKYYTDNEFVPLKNFIKDTGGIFYNFIVLDKLDVAFKIKNCCDVILNNKIGENENLEDVVRNLGKIIFNILTGGDNPCLNDIRSPYSFLTNLVGNDPNLKGGSLNDSLKKMTENKATIIENMDVELKKDDTSSMMNAIINNTKSITLSLLKNYFTTTNMDLSTLPSLNEMLQKLGNESEDDDYAPFNLVDYANDVEVVYTNLIQNAEKLGATKEDLEKMKGIDKENIKLIIQKLFLLADGLDTISGLIGDSNEVESNYYFDTRSIIIERILKPYDNNFLYLVNLMKAIIQNKQTILYTWVNSNINRNQEISNIEKYAKQAIQTAEQERMEEVEEEKKGKGKKSRLKRKGKRGRPPKKKKDSQ